jgi:hypothetical protein
LLLKKLALAVVVPLFLTGTACADPFSNLYGNTISVTTAGKTWKAYVNPDMTWEQHMSDGTVLKGTWSWQDANTACFILTDPAPKAGTPPNCAKVDEHKVGDTWTTTDANNQVMTFTAIAGR